MRTVWKYRVPSDDWFEVEMPREAQVLGVQLQLGQPVMWALVDPDAPTEPRQFRLAGTGHPVENFSYIKHIGTFQLFSGDLVFHLFEVRA